MKKYVLKKKLTSDSKNRLSSGNRKESTSYHFLSMSRKFCKLLKEKGISYRHSVAHSYIVIRSVEPYMHLYIEYKHSGYWMVKDMRPRIKDGRQITYGFPVNCPNQALAKMIRFRLINIQIAELFIN